MNTATLETLLLLLKETRLNYLADFIAQTATALESQGFTFTEVLDALANYAYINSHSTDTVLFLAQASYSSQGSGESPTSRKPSDSRTLEP